MPVDRRLTNYLLSTFEGSGITCATKLLLTPIPAPYSTSGLTLNLLPYVGGIMPPHSPFTSLLGPQPSISLHHLWSSSLLHVCYPYPLANSPSEPLPPLESKHCRSLQLQQCIRQSLRHIRFLTPALTSLNLIYSFIISH